jgi:hypothetical protein
VQVEYVDDTASFIGLSSSSQLSFDVFGVDPFRTEASELFALLAKHDGTHVAYNPNGHIFRTILVTLYDADEQYDPEEKQPTWAQVGIGDGRYLAAIDAIGS